MWSVGSSKAGIASVGGAGGSCVGGIAVGASVTSAAAAVAAAPIVQPVSVGHAGVTGVKSSATVVAGCRGGGGGR